MAKPSSVFPPAYSTATTTAASCSPSSRPADMETKATASTPRRPARTFWVIETSKAATTGRVPAVHTLAASEVFPVIENARPRASPAMAMAIRALVITRWDCIYHSHPVGQLLPLSRPEPQGSLREIKARRRSRQVELSRSVASNQEGVAKFASFAVPTAGRAVVLPRRGTPVGCGVGDVQDGRDVG